MIPQCARSRWSRCAPRNSADCGVKHGERLAPPRLGRRQRRRAPAMGASLDVAHRYGRDTSSGRPSVVWNVGAYPVPDEPCAPWSGSKRVPAGQDELLVSREGSSRAIRPAKASLPTARCKSFAFAESGCPPTASFRGALDDAEGTAWSSGVARR